MDLRAQSAARRWPHQRVLSREFAPRQFEYSPFFDDVIVCGTTQSEVLLVDHDHGTPLAYHSFVGKRRVDPILGLCWLNTRPDRFVSGSSFGALHMNRIDGLGPLEGMRRAGDTLGEGGSSDADQGVTASHADHHRLPTSVLLSHLESPSTGPTASAQSTSSRPLAAARGTTAPRLVGQTTRGLPSGHLIDEAIWQREFIGLASGSVSQQWTGESSTASASSQRRGGRHAARPAVSASASAAADQLHDAAADRPDDQDDDDQHNSSDEEVDDGPQDSGVPSDVDHRRSRVARQRSAPTCSAGELHIVSSPLANFGELTSLHVNCTDRFVMVSGYSRDVDVFDLETGKLAQRYERAHDKHINIARFCNHSPHVLASSSFDTTVKLWDLRVKSKPNYTIHSKNGFVMIAFSPDDQTILAAAVDNEVSQFATLDGRKVMELDMPRLGRADNYTRAYYCDQGSTIATGASEEGVLRFFCAHTGELQDTVTTIVGRDHPSAYVQSLRGSPHRRGEVIALLNHQDPSVTFQLHKLVRPSTLAELASDPSGSEEAASAPTRASSASLRATQHLVCDMAQLLSSDPWPDPRDDPLRSVTLLAEDSNPEQTAAAELVTADELAGSAVDQPVSSESAIPPLQLAEPVIADEDDHDDENEDDLGSDSSSDGPTPAAGSASPAPALRLVRSYARKRNVVGDDGERLSDIRLCVSQPGAAASTWYEFRLHAGVLRARCPALAELLSSAQSASAMSSAGGSGVQPQLLMLEPGQARASVAMVRAAVQFLYTDTLCMPPASDIPDAVLRMCGIDAASFGTEELIRDATEVGCIEDLGESAVVVSEATSLLRAGGRIIRADVSFTEYFRDLGDVPVVGSTDVGARVGERAKEDDEQAAAIAASVAADSSLLPRAHGGPRHSRTMGPKLLGPDPRLRHWLASLHECFKAARMFRLPRLADLAAWRAARALSMHSARPLAELAAVHQREDLWRAAVQWCASALPILRAVGEPGFAACDSSSSAAAIQRANVGLGPDCEPAMLRVDRESPVVKAQEDGGTVDEELDAVQKTVSLITLPPTTVTDFSSALAQDATRLARLQRVRVPFDLQRMTQAKLMAGASDGILSGRMRNHAYLAIRDEALFCEATGLVNPIAREQQAGQSELPPSESSAAQAAAAAGAASIPTVMDIFTDDDDDGGVDGDDDEDADDIEDAGSEGDDDSYNDFSSEADDDEEMGTQLGQAVNAVVGDRREDPFVGEILGICESRVMETNAMVGERSLSARRADLGHAMSSWRVADRAFSSSSVGEADDDDDDNEADDEDDEANAPGENGLSPPPATSPSPPAPPSRASHNLEQHRHLSSLLQLLPDHPESHELRALVELMRRSMRDMGPDEGSHHRAKRPKAKGEPLEPTIPLPDLLAPVPTVYRRLVRDALQAWSIIESRNEGVLDVIDALSSQASIQVVAQALQLEGDLRRKFAGVWASLPPLDAQHARIRAVLTNYGRVGRRQRGVRERPVAVAAVEAATAAAPSAIAMVPPPPVASLVPQSVAAPAGVAKDSAVQAHPIEGFVLLHIAHCGNAGRRSSHVEVAVERVARLRLPLKSMLRWLRSRMAAGIPLSGASGAVEAILEWSSHPIPEVHVRTSDVRLQGQGHSPATVSQIVDLARRAALFVALLESATQAGAASRNESSAVAVPAPSEVSVHSRMAVKPDAEKRPAVSWHPRVMQLLRYIPPVSTSHTVPCGPGGRLFPILGGENRVQYITYGPTLTLDMATNQWQRLPATGSFPSNMIRASSAAIHVPSPFSPWSCAPSGVVADLQALWPEKRGNSTLAAGLPPPIDGEDGLDGIAPVLRLRGAAWGQPRFVFTLGDNSLRRKGLVYLWDTASLQWHALTPAVGTIAEDDGQRGWAPSPRIDHSFVCVTPPSAPSWALAPEDVLSRARSGRSGIEGISSLVRSLSGTSEPVAAAAASSRPSTQADLSPARTAPVSMASHDVVPTVSRAGGFMDAAAEDLVNLPLPDGFYPAAPQPASVSAFGGSGGDGQTSTRADEDTVLSGLESVSWEDAIRALESQEIRLTHHLVAFGGYSWTGPAPRAAESGNVDVLRVETKHRLQLDRSTRPARVFVDTQLSARWISPVIIGGDYRPRPRAAHAACVLHLPADEGGSVMLINGGATRDDATGSDLFFRDSSVASVSPSGETIQWHHVLERGFVPSHRFGHTMIATGRRSAVIVGGQTVSGPAIDLTALTVTTMTLLGAEGGARKVVTYAPIRVAPGMVPGPRVQPLAALVPRSMRVRRGEDDDGRRPQPWRNGCEILVFGGSTVTAPADTSTYGLQDSRTDWNVFRVSLAPCGDAGVATAQRTLEILNELRTGHEILTCNEPWRAMEATSIVPSCDWRQLMRRRGISYARWLSLASDSDELRSMGPRSSSPLTASAAVAESDHSTEGDAALPPADGRGRVAPSELLVAGCNASLGAYWSVLPWDPLLARHPSLTSQRLEDLRWWEDGNVLPPSQRPVIRSSLVAMWEDVPTWLSRSVADGQAAIAVDEPTLAADLGRDLWNPTTGDVLLRAEGSPGTGYRTHRWLLAARSARFRAVLRSGLEESRSVSIALRDTDDASVRELLHFLGTDSLSTDLEPEVMMSLLQLAKANNEDRLARLCEASLTRHLNVDNACGLLQFADTYECGDLRAAAKTHVLAHWLEVLESGDLDLLPAELTEELVQTFLSVRHAFAIEARISAQQGRTPASPMMRSLGRSP